MVSYLYGKFPLKRSILLLIRHLPSLCLTCLSPIKGKVCLKTLDFKEEKLEKLQVEVIMFQTAEPNITSALVAFELLLTCVSECAFVSE